MTTHRKRGDTKKEREKDSKRETSWGHRSRRIPEQGVRLKYFSVFFFVFMDLFLSK